MKAKFYNPFRPHIVEFDNGTFAVRKLTLIGWAYYDNQKIGKDNDYWWSSFSNDTAVLYYTAESLDMAITLLEMLNLRKTIKSKRVKKVYP